VYSWLLIALLVIIEVSKKLPDLYLIGRLAWLVWQAMKRPKIRTHDSFFIIQNQN
tara:strand:+ start:60 stop:224 length:165 start_codon:yes stop_codon:yes gene_type:complete